VNSIETSLCPRATNLPVARPTFMSQQHVDLMNALLKDADAVKEMCASLEARRVLTYDLTGGPDGDTVHWTMTIEATVQFSLDRPSHADVVLTGDWSRMIRASRGAQTGAPQDPGLTVHGDMALVAQVSSILATARDVAAVPVTFPAV
jgi:hypothetical protein